MHAGNGNGDRHQAKITELLSEGIGDSERVLQPLKPAGPRGVVPCAVRPPTAK